MEYLTTAEAAERWGITARRVQTLCKNGRIEGAVYKGVWLIPVNAEKPEDPIPVNAEKPEDPRHVRRTEQKDSY